MSYIPSTASLARKGHIARFNLPKMAMKQLILNNNRQKYNIFVSCLVLESKSFHENLLSEVSNVTLDFAHSNISLCLLYYRTGTRQVTSTMYIIVVKYRKGYSSSLGLSVHVLIVYILQLVRRQTSNRKIERLNHRSRIMRPNYDT